jgi:hypothetical protein
MSWQDQLNGDAINWLLELDSPGVRYLALRDLLNLGQDDPELIAARRSAHQAGPIAAFLAEMQAGGYWVEPGPGYYPKYRGTVWSLISLAQLGASIAQDEHIGRACSYILDHALTLNGQFSVTGAPSGTIDCLQGNLCWALVELGCNDPRLDAAFEWMARSVTGEGVAPLEDKKAALRYYGAKCGPNFTCGANYTQPCAWGAAKVMLAFSRWPAGRRTPLIERAIRQGVDFLFSVDPAEACYPSSLNEKPSQNWWKFGFPVFYVTDILQIAEALAGLGYAQDPRLAHTLDVIVQKQDGGGRWALEYDYAGKTWGYFGEKKKPNKWVTLRALRTMGAMRAVS